MHKWINQVKYLIDQKATAHEEKICEQRPGLVITHLPDGINYYGCKLAYLFFMHCCFLINERLGLTYLVQVHKWISQVK
jgi:hypothetical protein